MEDKEFELMLHDEDVHWWYRARRRIVDNSLSEVFSQAKRIKVLDLASACGANLLHYKKYGEIYGVDIADKSIKFCRSKGIDNIIQGDVHELPFTAAIFDVVIALDALEHFKDDFAVLKEIRRVMKNNGLLIITSPALNILWSQHDEAFCHLRRYSKNELNNKLNQAGYNIEFISYWLCFLFLPVLMFRKCRDLLRILTKKRASVKSDFHTRLPSAVSFAFDCLSRIETYFINKKLSLPIGVSLFCAARKREYSL